MTRLRFPLAAAALATLAALFATNRQYVYSDALDALPRLTAGHIVDPRFAGATFQVEGRVTRVRTTRQGIVVVELHQAEEDLFVDAPVFPALGCLPVKPARGERVRVTGNLGMYAGQPQVKPLSAAHVELVAPPDIARASTAAAAAGRTGETVLIGPVQAVDLEFFESRRGLEHLRLALADVEGGGAPVAATAGGAAAWSGANGAGAGAGSRGVVQGIMYQGEQTDCEVDLLRSDEPLMVTAEIDTYRGAPSFNVKRVFRVDAADPGEPPDGG